jgi:hypothetical protein
VSDIERRRRQFVREHHPDRGGDPEEFIVGLRAFDTEQASWAPAARVVVIKREKWSARLVIAARQHLHRGRKSPRVR